MASSQPSNDAAPSPTNASPKPDDASTTSRGRYTPGKPKSVASETPMPPPKCHPITSETEDEWTSKCPPTVGKMSSLGGSDSWAMVRSSPEPGRVPTSQNTWSPSTSHQTTHSAPLPPF